VEVDIIKTTGTSKKMQEVPSNKRIIYCSRCYGGEVRAFGAEIHTRTSGRPQRFGPRRQRRKRFDRPSRFDPWGKRQKKFGQRGAAAEAVRSVGAVEQVRPTGEVGEEVRPMGAVAETVRPTGAAGDIPPMGAVGEIHPYRATIWIQPMGAAREIRPIKEARRN